MKQGTIKDIKKIGAYNNPHTNKENYKFDVYFDNNDCGQFRATQEQQDKYKVGQKLNYKIEKVGFNGGSWFKLIDLSKPTYKPKTQNKNGLQFKKIDVSLECQKQAILMLKDEIIQTHIQDENNAIFDRIQAIQERLFQDVFTVAKL